MRSVSPSAANPASGVPCARVLVPASPAASSFDWAGKSLQLIQSLLLILTFMIAFGERKRNRKADRFGDTVVKFAVELGDKLYANTERMLDGLRGSRGKFFSGDEFEDKRKRLLSDFARELFHARTLLILRAKLFSHCDLDRLNSIFEELEDNFALAVANLAIDDEHPEILTTNVAEASSKLLDYLLEREVMLERSSIRDRAIALCQRIRDELGKSV